MAIESILGGAGSSASLPISAGGGDAGPSSAYGGTSLALDHKTQGITIAPVGVNFGELINALLPGAPSNSGGTEDQGAFESLQSDIFSKLQTSNLGFSGSNTTSQKSPIQSIMIYGGMALIGFIAIKKFL